jgi:hypothetical protein
MAPAQAIRVGLRDFNGVKVEVNQIGNLAQQREVTIIEGPSHGFVSVVASEEVAEWTGRYGWTRQQWWQNPPSYVRFTGGVMLIVATIVPYRR